MKIPTDIQWAWTLIGGMSQTSKMPCMSYNLPAKDCITGQKLREIAGSVCNKCYALKGFYHYPNPVAAMDRRLTAIEEPRWVEAMTLVISTLEKSGYIRWHDSGDLQSLNHLEKICNVARNLPHIKFWLPTREYKFITEYKKTKGQFPSNLIIRLSAYMVDGEPPTEIASRSQVLTSTVQTVNFTCPASEQGNQCLDCRKCWDGRVKNIAYKKH